MPFVILPKKTQKQILNAHKVGKTFVSQWYEYGIEYNPLAETHTWIIRKKRTGGEWEWLQPVDKNIG